MTDYVINFFKQRLGFVEIINPLSVKSMKDFMRMPINETSEFVLCTEKPQDCYNIKVFWVFKKYKVGYAIVRKRHSYNFLNYLKLGNPQIWDSLGYSEDFFKVFEGTTVDLKTAKGRNFNF